MLAALGAVSTIFDALKSLSSSTATPSQVTTGFTQNTTAFSATTTTSTATNAPVISGGGSTVGNLSPDTLNALFAAQGEPPVKSKADALSDLFGLLDADGSGRISKSEFEGALGAGGTNTAAADRVFGKLDTDGDGAVSADELAAALTTPKKKDDHRPESASVNDPLKKALSGASTTTTSNSDGSVTTTVTYADGSKVTLTSPPSNAASNAASSSYNFVERAIQRQAQAISASAAASVSVSA